MQTIQLGHLREAQFRATPEFADKRKVAVVRRLNFLFGDGSLLIKESSRRPFRLVLRINAGLTHSRYSNHRLCTNNNFPL